MRISLRYKIQFAVLLIVITTLAVYITLASQTLLKEKIASLLETTASDAEVASSRIGRKLVAQEFWLEGVLAKSSPQVTETLQSQQNLLAVVKKSGPNLERVFDRSPHADQVQTPFSTPKGLSVVLRPSEKNFWLMKVSENGDALASLWSHDLFAEEQRDIAEGALFLISGLDQEVLPLSSASLAAVDFAATLPKTGLPRTLTSSQKEINSEKYIVASAPIDYFPLSIAVAYPESLAFEPVKQLQVRSIYFAIFVLGLTGMLAFWIGRALTQKLSELTGQTTRIAQGDLDSARAIRAGDEIGDLSKSIVAMAGDLKKYIREVSEKSRMEAELKTAKTVQDMLFPETGWSDDRFEISGYYESASECGGDLWFYWQVEDKLFFLIADATGHGAPAALITSAARSTIATVEYSKEKRVGLVAELLHHAVKESSKGKILMTAWLGCLDTKSGRCEYVNCSHESPFVVDAAGSIQVLTDSISPRLGDCNAGKDSFQVSQFHLSAGERLCLYTDGVCDVLDPRGQRLSDRKFAALMGNSFGERKPLETSLKKMIATLREFSANSPLDDDRTMVILGAK